ncbi:uncharacterized protein CCDC197 isoform X2 [Sarcophilus harrisii]|uniref:uncharacterized protein CCDC197 isoform X2 n=1 Tax=Sarcophilus harrisii TaxID=9305 RepID=UPI00062B5FEE|nr:uncharacterized protein CCDC197 isoform X2 [Sarcophilus harrisii]
MLQPSSISSAALREKDNENFMNSTVNENSHQMHEASVKPKKHENTVSTRENSSTEERLENTPVQLYENHRTQNPRYSVNTLQNDLIFSAQILADDEFIQVNKMLEAKRKEWKKRIENVTKGKIDLLQGQKYRNQLMDKLLKESKVKKKQALEEWAADVKINKIKQEEIDHLSQELRELQARKQMLKKKMEKYRPFEDFLAKVLDKLPNCYRSWDLNSSIKKIIDHYEILSKTNKNLTNQVSKLSDAYKKVQKNLEVLQLQHTNNTLALNTELSTLQKKFDEIKGKNSKMKMAEQLKKSILKDEDQDIGSTLIIITNLAQKCQIQHYGPLTHLDLGCKLEMIQEFMLDKMETKKLVESQEFWDKELIESYPQKIQEPDKKKLTDRISSPGVPISKITVPQAEMTVKLPTLQAHCLKPLNLPKSQEVQACLPFPCAHKQRYTMSPYIPNSSTGGDTKARFSKAKN